MDERFIKNRELNRILDKISSKANLSNNEREFIEHYSDLSEIDLQDYSHLSSNIINAVKLDNCSRRPTNEFKKSDEKAISNEGLYFKCLKTTTFFLLSIFVNIKFNQTFGLDYII